MKNTNLKAQTNTKGNNKNKKNPIKQNKRNKIKIKKKIKSSNY